MQLIPPDPQFFKKRLDCPACGKTATKQENIFGIISPWVLELGEIESQRLFHRYLICENCGSGWFGVSYPEQLLQKLYEGYRGEHYFKVRNSWDKTYTRILNDGLKNDKNWMMWRKNCVETLLRKSNFDPTKISCCVDIGGGEGGVIPDFPNAKKYILETNVQIRLPKDIARLNSYNQLTEVNPDFIMCCGLLEHLNSPKEFLEFLAKSVPKKSIYYFEVPAGIPKPRTMLKVQKRMVIALALSRGAWRGSLKLDKLARRHLNLQILPLRISEHLNFFSEQGLIQLFRLSGFQVISVEQFSTNSNLPDGKKVAFSSGWQVLARIDM